MYPGPPPYQTTHRLVQWAHHRRARLARKRLREWREVRFYIFIEEKNYVAFPGGKGAYSPDSGTKWKSRPRYIEKALTRLSFRILR